MWWNLKKIIHRERANGLFYFESLFYFLFPDPHRLDEENNKKMETFSISWVVPEKLPNLIEIAEIPEFIFIFFY